MMPTEEAPSPLQLIGRVIVNVRRVWYCLQGEVISGHGPIELSFSDGSVARFDAGADGEELVHLLTKWVDPFVPPLSPENERYVNSAGKWTAFEVAGTEPYARLVGAAVENVEMHVSERGKFVGAAIRAGDVVVRIQVEGDELAVHVE